MKVNLRVIAALFYPLTVAAISAGFLAFVLLVFNMSPLFVATVTLWFYFLSALTIYAISRGALKVFGLRWLFMAVMSTVGVLAALSLLFLLLGYG